MRRLFVLLAAVIALSGCADMKVRWDNLEPAEKVVVGVVGVGAVGVLILRNGHGHGHGHGCYYTRWGCP